MDVWLGKFRKSQAKRPTRKVVVAKDGLTIGQIVTHWPPWNKKYQEQCLYWKDTVRVTVQQWDCVLYDIIGMIFEGRDGQCLIVTEEDFNLHSTFQLLLPQVLPGIADPDHWFDIIASEPPYPDSPFVIYERG
jgi:hypothetical protein